MSRKPKPTFFTRKQETRRPEPPQVFYMSQSEYEEPAREKPKPVFFNPEQEPAKSIQPPDLYSENEDDELVRVMNSTCTRSEAVKADQEMEKINRMIREEFSKTWMMWGEGENKDPF